MTLCVLIMQVITAISGESEGIFYFPYICVVFEIYIKQCSYLCSIWKFQLCSLQNWYNKTIMNCQEQMIFLRYKRDSFDLIRVVNTICVINLCFFKWVMLYQYLRSELLLTKPVAPKFDLVFKVFLNMWLFLL